MLCFQLFLFGGYAYAHVTERYLSVRAQTVLHLALLLGCIALLPITPDPSWKPVDNGNPSWRIICLLTATVGLPYFALSTTGPLLQAWFSRSYPDRSPYRLYALSNLGSLVALVSYPFVFEPLFSSRMQTRVWSWSFGLFLILCGYCTLCVRQFPRSAPPSGEPLEQSSQQHAVPTWRARLSWVLLPAFASLVLLATTNHVCQDVAVIPFLWVAPLGLYLLTFIISFDHSRWYRRRAFAGAAMALTLCAALLNDPPISLGFVGELGTYFATMFVLCMVCHGELVRMRPSTRHLTGFYLLVSAGGALGGILVSLVAPRVFSTFLEWKIVLAGGYALGASLLLGYVAGRPWGGRRGVELAAFGALAACGFGALLHYQAGFADTALRTQMGDLYNSDYRTETRATSRSFYGVVTVLERFGKADARHDFAMFNGQIPHGVQFAPPAQDQTTTYFAADSGLAHALGLFAAQPGDRVAVVGLGVGTIAAYAQAGQTFRFYEINPDVERLATRYFSFLARSRGAVELVLGDARLSLARELRAPHAAFQVFVLDAFSGDAIPTHLLTQEAFDIYSQHLAAGGAIVIHVSNKYLNLLPVVNGLAAENGLETVRVLTHGDDARTTYRADWMILSRDSARLAELRKLPQAADSGARRVLWTDEHSNLFQILR
jgi:spermidine synthase